MTESPVEKQTSDVPTQVFEEFLQSLPSDGMAEDMVTRLQKALLQDKEFTEQALKKAVFGEEQSQ